MNYDQARQLGADSEAPGKWNWTTMNDGVVWTAPPCAYPEYDWPDHFDVLNPPRPTGRPRCDHDTREEAERHYWEDRRDHIREERLDLDTIRERRRCDVPDCPDWEDWRMHWPGGYLVDSLCDRHRFESAVLHPFTPGLQVIHS